jgi:radical S-adenosyl methionine domain-containing protein 2
MRCRYCFATFRDVAGVLGRAERLELIRRLAAAGFEKITFAGGEPTLSRDLPALVREAKAAGMTTMVVTNGTRLHRADWVFGPRRPLDWVALSIDSVDPLVHRALGRAERGTAPLSPERYIRLCTRLREAGVRLKINTVVSALNVGEDLTAFIRALRPERWKVLRVLPVRGQNDGRVEPLEVTAEDFRAFVARHRPLESEGIAVVGEDHEDIVGGYAMIDPLGRFFDDTKREHTYSAPILDVGVDAAFAGVTFSHARFVQRGGVYQWQPAAVGGAASERVKKDTGRLVAFIGRSGSGKDAAASSLVDRGYVRVAVADALKRTMKLLFELTDGQLWGPGRDRVDPRLGATPRALYQRLSDACRSIDPMVWLRPWRAEIAGRLEAGERVVCTDVRTLEDLEVIRALGGIVVRVRRSGSGAVGEAASHATETELDRVGDAEVDAVIVNDGTIEELSAAVSRAVFGE